MLRLRYDKQVDSTGNKLPSAPNPSKIAWDNLVEIASIFHLPLVTAASTAWFQANPHSGLQDLERKLREQKVPVYLIATEPTTDQPGKLVGINNPDQNPEYCLVYCCRPDKSAQTEILQHSASYTENFQKLARTGVIQVTDDADGEGDLSLPEAKQQALAKSDVMAMVSHNMVSLKLEQLSETQINNQMNQDIAEATRASGSPSEAKPIGTAPDGSPVLAHFVDGRVISEYGLMVAPDQRTKIVVVTDQTTWTGF